MFNHSIILIFSIFFSSCSIFNRNKELKCINYEFATLCNDAINYESINGTENDKKSITFKNLVIESETGKNVNKGPETLNEYIKSSFRNYYYSQFFEKIHLDNKVQKLFRDSVSFVAINKIIPDKLNECKVCNIQLLIKFKNDEYPFELFISEAQIKTFEEAKIDIVENDGIKIKFFQSLAGNGAFIQKSNYKKNDKNISLMLTSGSFEEFKLFILKSIKSNTKDGN